MGFVEQQDRSPLPGRRFLGAYPESLPEAGNGGLGTVRGGIDRRFPVPLRELEQQRGLSNLPRAGEKLDPTRRRLGEPAR
jgi:hypothetical protein